MTWAPPRRILAIGWLVFLLYAYPGYMGAEAGDQLFDSRTGEVTDWHSPMLTAVWQVVGLLVSGPAGMLFLQSLLLLGGTFVLLRRALPERVAAVASSGVLLFPPVLATMGQIVPEAQLAGFLVAGAAALTSEPPRLKLCGLGLLVIASGMRPGAPVAVLCVIIALFVWREGLSRVRRFALAAGAGIAVVLVSSVIVYSVVDVRSHRNEISLAMSDIVGTLRYAPAMPDAEVRSVLGDTALAVSTGIQQRARELYGKPARYASGDDRLFDPPTGSSREALLGARRSVALSAPVAYLRHRLRVFLPLIGWTRTPSAINTEFVAGRDHSISLAHAARHSLVQRLLVAPVRWSSRTIVHRPYVYAILALVLLPLAIGWRERTAAVLLASALSYEVALLFVVVRPSGTESLPLLVATLLAAVLVVSRRFRAAA